MGRQIIIDEGEYKQLLRKAKVTAGPEENLIGHVEAFSRAFAACYNEFNRRGNHDLTRLLEKKFKEWGYDVIQVAMETNTALVPNLREGFNAYKILFKYDRDKDSRRDKT